MYLNTHSYYSLRYGTLSIDKLLKLALQHNAEALALTDINTTMGIPEFIRAASLHGIKPIAGCEFRNEDQLLYIGLAQNQEGLKELNEWLTSHNLEKRAYPELAPSFNHVYIIYPFNHLTPLQLKENEFIGIRPEEVNKLLTSPLAKTQHKLIILQPITVYNQASWFLHKSLRAIDHNTLISKLDQHQYAPTSEVFSSQSAILDTFMRYPQLIKNTQRLIKACSISMDFTTLKNKRVFGESIYTDKQKLEELALQGMLKRYGSNNTTARERINHELSIIFKLGFASYFLIAWDMIRYSMSQGIYHVGRGSGANSIVAYCLQITDVDPIKLNLYFERFLNPKRTVPPDFDIDYSWRDRETIQSYIFDRYGKAHTALLGATTTFKGRSIYRELGKVFGLPKEEIDRLVLNPTDHNNANRITQTINQLATYMLDFPNSRSIHAGGILISEQPLTYYTALDLPPKGFPTTQWDMYTAEDLRFEKLDILSQRGIGHIKETVEIVQENQGEAVDIDQIDRFIHDEKVKAQLRTANTNGCFYIESPAMRGLLTKLQCEDYLTLVAASSIIRPGVAKSGMMRQYIHRFHHPLDFKYLHPIMKEQLEETFGVMVYQEDVIKIAHHFAGLDLAEADVLRRAMSGKYRSRKEFKRIEFQFFQNCKDRGYPESLSQEVWRQIESFAGYSFSKAHSASYAVESFQSLFLKTYYPLEFMVAVINNLGGFYRSWVYFNEAQRCGATIKLPCVNHSRQESRIIGKDIYIGLRHVLNLTQDTMLQLLAERLENGSFHSLADFISRVKLGKEQLIILIRLGAFRFTQKTKAQLLWEAHLLLNKPVAQSKSQPLFQVQDRHYQLPPLEQSLLRDAYEEIELLEFPVSMSPFDMLQTNFRGEVFAHNLLQHTGQKLRMLGRLVALKYVRTVKKETMHFGTFTDAHGNFFDSVHFPPSLKQYPFKGDGIYLLLGKVVEEFGFPSLEVEKMAKMPYQTID